MATMRPLEGTLLPRSQAIDRIERSEDVVMLSELVLLETLERLLPARQSTCERKERASPASRLVANCWQRPHGDSTRELPRE